MLHRLLLGVLDTVKLEEGGIHLNQMRQLETIGPDAKNFMDHRMKDISWIEEWDWTGRVEFVAGGGVLGIKWVSAVNRMRTA